MTTPDQRAALLAAETETLEERALVYQSWLADVARNPAPHRDATFVALLVRAHGWITTELEWRRRDTVLRAIFARTADGASPRAEPEPVRVPAVGALVAWRDELRRGVGGQRGDRPLSWRYDALWEAACLEARANDCDRQQLLGTADDLRMKAARIMAGAAKVAKVAS